MAANRGNGIRFGTREMAGAVADIGVLLPIAVALIVSNGLSATAVLLPAGLLYVAVALVYGAADPGPAAEGVRRDRDREGPRARTRSPPARS